MSLKKGWLFTHNQCHQRINFSFGEWVVVQQEIVGSNVYKQSFRRKGEGVRQAVKGSE